MYEESKMTKREMIDEILAINLSAQPQFLARFDDEDLEHYLTHLRVLSTPRLADGPAGRYDKYFRDVPKIASPRPQWRHQPQVIEEVEAAADDLPAEEAAEEPAEPEPQVEDQLDCEAEIEAETEMESETDCTPETDRQAQCEAEADCDEQLHAEALAALEAAAEEAAAGHELDAHDVDLAVGQEERQQLLDVSAVAADDDAEAGLPDESSQETPFRLSSQSQKRTRSSRPAVSTAARQMLCSADAAPSAPRPRRNPITRAQAAG